MITKEQLIEFGLIENDKPDKIIYPLKKTLGKNDIEDDNDENSIDLVVTMEFNDPVLAISLPEGDLVLGGIETLDELKVIVKAIY